MTEGTAEKYGRLRPHLDKEGAARASLEELVRWRRDVRRFLTDPVPVSTLNHILRLADQSPSVGNSQPWRIVSVACPLLRVRVRENFESTNERAASAYQGEQAQLYGSLKLAGFDKAPVHLAVFADHGAAQGLGLGRKTMPESLDQSAVCMITLLWLAARAEGLGLGWVSIVDPREVSRVLNAPPQWRLTGYLLLGWPEEEHLDPELERAGWQARTPFESRFHELEAGSKGLSIASAPPIKP